MFESCEGNLNRNAQTKCTRHKGIFMKVCHHVSGFLHKCLLSGLRAIFSKWRQKKKKRKITNFNISCLCHYRIQPSPSFPMSASSLLPSLSSGLWNLTTPSIIEGTQWACLVPNTCTHSFLCTVAAERNNLSRQRGRLQ